MVVSAEVAEEGGALAARVAALEAANAKTDVRTLNLQSTQRAHYRQVQRMCRQVHRLRTRAMVASMGVCAATGALTAAALLLAVYAP